MRPGIESGIGRHLLFQHSKVASYPPAELRRRAARVDKGEQQRFAPELTKMNWPAILIAQLEIRHRVSRSGHMIGNCWFVIGLGLRHHDNMVKQNLRIRILRDHHIGGNHVARMQFAQDARIHQLVGHGHGLHEAGNGLMVHRYLALGGIGGDHLTAHFVDLSLKLTNRMIWACGWLRGWLLAGVASGQHDKGKQRRSKQSSHHRVSVHLFCALRYNVRLNSGVAMSSALMPKAKRKNRSNLMASKPPSLRIMDLNPWIAYVKGSTMAMARSHAGKEATGYMAPEG